MTSPTPAATHRDHVRWQEEVAMWREDIRQWQKEHELALLALTSAIACHNSALEAHWQSIGEHESNVLEAEHRIVEFERSPLVAGEKDCDIGDPHRQHADKQQLLRETHERIKRHHYSAMAKLGVLARALEAEM